MDYRTLYFNGLVSILGEGAGEKSGSFFFIKKHTMKRSECDDITKNRKQTRALKAYDQNFG